MRKFAEFINLYFNYHLLAAFVIRFCLIVYSNFHDKYNDVPYTDVDYRVFTDAARHVLNGDSPYKRHTYRYSPLVAYLMTPNVLISKDFGKVIFSVFDIFVAIALKKLVEQQLATTDKSRAWKIAKYSSYFWLYNPLSIAISTRGNADSVPCFFVIVALYLLQADTKVPFKFGLAGLVIGCAVHLRLYPVVFLFPMYLSLGKYNINRSTPFSKAFLSLLPNRNQIIFTTFTVVSFAALTYSMYHLYSYEFLFETYIYHLFRKDIRHNFSVLFYYTYLSADQLMFDVVKTITQVFEAIILFVISLAFGCDPKTLHFALFCQSVVLVAYNSVVTSQYFIWFLSLLPLVVHNFKMVPGKALVLTLIWVGAQAAWLFYAYLLEFRGRESFILIWLQGVIFFCSNVFALGHLIKSHTPDYGFGQICVKNK